MIYKKIVRNSFALFAAVLVNSVCLFGSNIVMARVLTRTDYGAVIFVLSIAGLIMLFLDMGVYNSVMILLPKALVKKKNVAGTISSSLELSFFLGLAAAALLFVLSFFMPEGKFGQRMTVYLRIACLWPVFFFLIRTSRGIFISGSQDYRNVALSNGSLEPFRFLAVLLSLLVFNLGIVGILYGWFIAYIISFAFLAWLLSRLLRSMDLKLKLNPFGDLENKGVILKQGIYLLIPFIAPFVTPYTLNAILGFLSTPKELSFFAVSISLVMLNMVLIKPLELALLPAASESFSNSRLKDLQATNNILQKYLAIAGITIASVFLFFGREIVVFVYGAKYAGAAAIIGILSIAVFFEMNRIVVDPVLKGAGHAKLVSGIEAAKMALAFIVGILLVNRFGAIGVSIAFLSASFSAIVLKYYYAYKKLGFFNKVTTLQALFLLAVLVLCFILKLHFVVFLPVLLVMIFKMSNRNELKLIKFKIKEAFAR